MIQDIEKFVAKCKNCQQMKYEHQRPEGLLKKDSNSEMEVGKDSNGFYGCSLEDFGKFDSIWVVVDRLTKSAHFILVRVDYYAKHLASIYVKEIVRFHGMPLSIISDSGTLFTSMFWRNLHF